MSIGGIKILLIFMVFVILYFIAIVYLSKKDGIFWGLVLPAISADIALYNFIKPMVVYNPNPTMKEGIYMTFYGVMAILGLILFLITRYISRNKKLDC
ncbi:MAG: hypothetical protein GX787_01200 [Tissierellia bacterium]|jgi:hypothetical protein|nr:hypothetical protein [Tissierellia bacterium]